MPTQSDPSDTDLIAAIRKHGPNSAAGSAALQVLYDRHMEKLVRWFHRRIGDPDTFFHVTQMTDHNTLASEVFDKAVAHYQANRGRFGSLLLCIAYRRLADGFRRMGRPLRRRLRPAEGGEHDLVAAPGVDPCQHLVLAEIRALTCRCLRKMGLLDRRRAFVWRELLDIGARELAGLWTEKSYDNIRQLHSRGTAQFLQLWQAGGGFELVGTAGAILEGRREMGDPERIRHPLHREAYRIWLRCDHDLGKAATQLGLTPETARRRILNGLEELLEIATERGRPKKSGKPTDFQALAKFGDAFGDYLEAGRDRAQSWQESSAEQQRLCDAVNHQLTVIRVALGLAKPTEVTQTLGGIVHERVLADGPKAYPKWQRALGLKPAAFRRLLGDDLEVSDALLGRLARELDRPATELRRLIAARSATRTRVRGEGDRAALQKIRAHVLGRRR